MRWAYMVKWGISLKLVICPSLGVLCLLWRQLITSWILLSAWFMTKDDVKTRDWANSCQVDESLDFFWLKLNNLKKLLKLKIEIILWWIMYHETSRSFCPVYPQQMDCKRQSGTLKITKTIVSKRSNHMLMMM
jgi:hypothetical protein